MMLGHRQGLTLYAKMAWKDETGRILLQFQGLNTVQHSISVGMGEKCYTKAGWQTVPLPKESKLLHQSEVQLSGPVDDHAETRGPAARLGGPKTVLGCGYRQQHAMLIQDIGRQKEEYPVVEGFHTALWTSKTSLVNFGCHPADK